MSMTAHQQEVSSGVTSSVDRGHKRIILKGSAGVGKTFVAKELVMWFLRNYLNKFTDRWDTSCIYVTAPTNKALSILQGKMPEHPKIVFKTVHSALRLRRDVNAKTGEVKFVPDYSERNPAFEGCRLAIIDECSMLPSYLLDLLDDFKFPIIFLGDDKQLNPVGEAMSPVFNRGYPEFELMEIVRQGAGNPIIELSRNLDLIYTRKPNIIDGMGYTYLNARDKIIENLAEVNGTDEMKYISWINADVDSVNTIVRKRLYGEHPSRIENHETLVFNAPFGDIYTNKEVRVDDVKVVIEEIAVPTSFSKYDRDNIPNAVDRIKMKVYRVNDTVRVLHEHSDNMFRIVLNTLKTNCSKFGWNWKGKFFFEEQFASIKYNHAITIHKSQGSTYKDTIMNVGGVLKNRNVDERNRLLYTGITRAANLLIINNL